MQASGSLGSAVKGFGDPREARIVRFDVLLLVATLGLIACSVYTIGTATEGDIAGQPYHYVIRQAVYGAVGLVLMLLVTRFDYSRMRELRLGLYGATIAGILFVLALGATTRGSKRWIEFPFFRFQPSELGKVFLVLALSAFVVDRVRRLSERETTSRILLLAMIPSILVVAQPDLGTGMVYLVIALAVLFVAGTKWTHFAAFGLLGTGAVTLVLIVAPAAGIQVLKPYQIDRLTAFVNPSDDPQD